MLNTDEQSRLASFREMATMNQGQALEYHELLDKEYAEDMKPVTASASTVTYTINVEEPKKRGRKKK
mgnify:CR=1 FL=1